jgi:hypothetical protein
MIFTTPAAPSASYLEEGFVITSTETIELAGIIFNASFSFLPLYVKVFH